MCSDLVRLYWRPGILVGIAMFVLSVGMNLFGSVLHVSSVVDGINSDVQDRLIMVEPDQ